MLRCGRCCTDDVIIAAIAEGTLKPELTEREVATLRAANVHEPVMVAMGAPAAVSAAPSCAPISLSTDYHEGAHSFQLMNESAKQYNNVRITVNGTHTYSLKRLPAREADSIGLGSFKSGGGALTAKEGVHRIAVRANEGCWSAKY